MKIKPLLIALLFILTGCSQIQETPAAKDDRPQNLEEFYSQEINWEECGRAECASLMVPLNYQDPQGELLQLALTKVPAQKKSERIGSLVVNPGGPGGSGVDYAKSGADLASQQVLDRFDIVGFDPRGVANSDPIQCLTDSQIDEFVQVDGTPDSPKELQLLIQAQKDMATACQIKNPDLWANIGSWNVARDMDILRAALGEQKLNWLGKSYGTLLGALYAQLFPEQVGLFVLDGPVDPNPDLDHSIIQIRAFESALKRFIADCISKPDCPLTKDAAQAYQDLIDFVERLDLSPLKTDSDRDLYQASAYSAIILGLYDDKDLWPFLRDALSEAFAGDGTWLLLLSDLINSRSEDGIYEDNSLAALYAVNCVDYPDALAESELITEAARLTKESKFFGELFGLGSTSCSGWVGKDVEELTKLDAKPESKVLIIATTYDPATPPVWGKGLQKQISNSVYIEWNGDGHTAYKRGSKCVDDIVDDYLLSGKLPPNNKVCPEIKR